MQNNLVGFISVIARFFNRFSIVFKNSISILKKNMFVHFKGILHLCLKNWNEPNTETNKWSSKSWLWLTRQKWAVSLKTTYINLIFRIKTMTHTDPAKRNPFFFSFFCYLNTFVTGSYYSYSYHYDISNNLSNTLKYLHLLWFACDHTFKLHFTQT